MSATHPIQTETTADRHARQQTQCRRMAELGMMLAEAAAARAAMAFAHPPPGPEQAGEPSRPPRAPHPATLFNQICSGVRQAIKLEERVVAGTTQTRADPRRARIRIAIRHATQQKPDRFKLRAQADDLLETELALDPDGTTPLPELLTTICEDLGFELDYEELATALATAPDPQPDWPHPERPPPPRPPH